MHHVIIQSMAFALWASTPLGTFQRCVQAEADRLAFSGVVSIVQPQGPVTYARGILDGPRSPSIDANTRFNLASAGKMFTAVAVAQLVDAGQVRLDEPIGRHIAGLAPETSQVTIRQLLDHSSGLGNFFKPENLAALQHARNVSELLPLVAAEKPSFTPGSRFEYSNTGFLLLGVLIERLSTLTYGKYLEQHIFKLAGMVASGLEPGPSSDRAVGLTERTSKGSLRPAPESALHGTPAGGAFTTATDMQRFFEALLAGRLMSASMLKEFTSPQMVMAAPNGGGPQLSSGLGFGVGTFQGHGWFGHNGGAPGVNTETAVFPEERTTMVVLSNRDPPAATALFRTLRAAVLDSETLQSCATAASASPGAQARQPERH